MATALVTNISKVITQYEVTAGNLDFLGQTVTTQVNLLDAAGTIVETKTFTKTFVELGLTVTQANVVKTKIIDKLKMDEVIN